MAKLVKRLVSTALSTLPEGMHPDGEGLYLQVKGSSRSWLYRYKPKGSLNSRYMGLGAYPTVSLKQVRERLLELQTLRFVQIDPIDARRKEQMAAKEQARQEKEQAQAEAMTFKKCAEDFIEASATASRNGCIGFSSSGQCVAPGCELPFSPLAPLAWFLDQQVGFRPYQSFKEYSTFSSSRAAQ